MLTLSVARRLRSEYETSEASFAVFFDSFGAFNYARLISELTIRGSVCTNLIQCQRYRDPFHYPSEASAPISATPNRSEKPLEDLSSYFMRIQTNTRRKLAHRPAAEMNSSAALKV